jgi:hypothetical protein
MDAFHLEKRNLFGGMAQICLPKHLSDVSQIRHVPDHQEVFVDTAKVVDRSLIVEILEYDASVHQKGEDHAAKFHYEELAKDNEAFQCRVDRVETQVAASSLSNPKAKVSILHGKQKVSKYKESSEAANEVYVALALVCLPDYMTDILITLNTPLAINPKSSTYKYAATEAEADSPESTTSNAASQSETQIEESNRLFRAMLDSFKVVDYRLFGHG